MKVVIWGRSHTGGQLPEKSHRVVKPESRARATFSLLGFKSLESKLSVIGGQRPEPAGDPGRETHVLRGILEHGG